MSFVETSILKNATIMLLHAEREEIDLNPDYQRMGGVWTITKKRLLIDSIINDYDIPKLYFHILGQERYRESGYRYAVIDGRQRLETIWSFMDGEFTLSTDFDYQRDPDISLAGLSYDDIAKQHPKIRIKFDSFVLPVITVETADDDLDLIEDMFSRLNEAVPLNAAEKRNALGGELVAAINQISGNDYFKNNVKFNNSRYKHREVAARFLLIEDSLTNGKALIDTKREYLDSIAKRYHDGPADQIKKLKTNVTKTLNHMASEFTLKDELLSAQGIQTVYYLVFRTALKNKETNLVSRTSLLQFRKALAENRNNAATDYEEASFELLEFDRLSQQGTNDASGLKERYLTLCNYLGITVDPGIIRSNEPLSV